MPLPEVILWKKIRNCQMGIKFRRQYTMGKRIIDFFAPTIKLGIELDGETHFYNEKHRVDEIIRDKKLFKERGIKILRFLNLDVMNNLEGVLSVIENEIDPLLNPPPLRGGGMELGQ